MEVKFYDTVNDELLKFAVIISRSNGKWVFCKHKERDTYEVPGGHSGVLPVNRTIKIINFVSSAELRLAIFLCYFYILIMIFHWCHYI